MSKWICPAIVLLTFTVSTPAQAELFSRLGLFGGPGVVQSEMYPAPVMAGPQKMGAVQSGGYPFVGGCCEAKTPCCGSAWNGFCGGCRGCWGHRLNGWFAARGCGSSCGSKCGGGAMQKCGGATQKCGGATQKCGGAMQKCGGATQKFGGAMQKCGGAMQKCGGATQKFGGAAQKCGGATQKFGGAAQKCGGAAQCGPVQKGGFGAFQKGARMWAPKCGPTCGPKCGAPACGKGCGCGSHGFSLFGRRHACHGCGGCSKGGCATVYGGKGGYKSYGGGAKFDYGTPVPSQAPAEIIEEPSVPTPAPIVPPVPEKSARRFYSLFN